MDTREGGESRELSLRRAGHECVFFLGGEVGQSKGSWWLMYVDVGSATSMRGIITQGYALK